ncbi:hypothetical protein BKA70DRAFT_1226158 [Coprinopsis sp. MPI-PUGE-AT-0042]|nr:hypothetical protein BKA70DRAFT_1226158 [Coprinopsis sp. MPI-PUGE-AT-0042]
MPAFEIQRCTEDDIPRFFEIVSLAFANDHEYVDAVFPMHTTSSRAQGRKRAHAPNIPWRPPMATSSKSSTKEHWQDDCGSEMEPIKGGDIPPQPEIGGDYWENEDEKEFAQCIFHSFFAPRQRVIEETGARLAALEMLMVDPPYQNKGAGRMLVKWGLAAADEMGVDGQDRGRRLYASEGFEWPHTMFVLCPRTFGRATQADVLVDEAPSADQA